MLTLTPTAGFVLCPVLLLANLKVLRALLVTLLYLLVFVCVDKPRFCRPLCDTVLPSGGTTLGCPFITTKSKLKIFSFSFFCRHNLESGYSIFL